MLFMSTLNNRGGNPHVQAIQSRVADLMRRYDESVSESDTAVPDDDDDEHIDVPSRWRVGDVLMATHNSLAKTGTRTERTILSEFNDDPEVVEALGDGEKNFAVVVEQAAQKSQQMHQMLARTIAMVKQLQLSDGELQRGQFQAAGEQGQQVRELKVTVDALQKEKKMVLSQLQEQVKAHKEMLAVMDEQNQELKRAQIAISMKADEMKMKSEDFDRRLTESQRALDTSQQSVSVWREKHQAATKSQASAEQKIVELEKKVQAQAEEIVKHEVVLQAKTQEDKHKDKLKDSEIQRLKAEVAAATQSLADHEERKAKRSESSDHQKAAFAKEKQDLLHRLQQAEATIQDLKSKLSYELQSKHQFESDNSELSRLVMEMKERARQVMSQQPLPESDLRGKSAILKKATSFAISLRALSLRGSKSAGSKATEKVNDDDLSTSSDDEDSEIEEVERELNTTVQQVVTSAFPQHRRALDQSDDNITENIALYEDPKNTPMQNAAVAARKRNQELPPSKTPPSSSSPAVASADVASVPMTEVERMKLACDEELARMKKQYVAGLIEYKRLVIEQYERRQSQIRDHHRNEIENLIMLVQEKFKREIEKHGEKMLRAKESLKLLYRAMKVEGGSLFDRPTSSLGDDVPETSEEPVPLKSLLRAAVFAMSDSKKRSTAATVEIRQIYETVKAKKELGGFKAGFRRASVNPNPPMSAVPSKIVIQTSRPILPIAEERPSSREKPPVLLLHISTQVCEEDLRLLNFGKGFRGNGAPPERMDDFVLSNSSLFGNQSGGTARGQHRKGQRSRGCHGDGEMIGAAGGVILHLVEGAVFSDEIVSELRGMLPSLPAGAYYLSSALKQKLLLELLKFYSAWDARHLSSSLQDSSRIDGVHTRTHGGDVEVVIGSPRDTPFMRRKALEAVQKQQIHQRRRQLLASGGEAVIQSSSSSSLSRATTEAMMAWPTPRASPSLF